jgi:hypothetical protein
LTDERNDRDGRKNKTNCETNTEKERIDIVEIKKLRNINRERENWSETQK